MLQTHHISITNLLNTFDSPPVLSSLLSGGVALSHSGGVHSTDLPQDTFAMTTLYKPISGFGDGIRRIFDVKSSNNTIFDFKSRNNTDYED